MNADALAYLADKGLSIEEIIEFARLSERKRDNTAAERQARKRERDRHAVTVTRDNDAKENFPQTPIKENTPVEPDGSTRPPADGELEAEHLKAEHVRDYWNDMAPRIGRPPIKTLTPERRKLVDARIAGYTIDDFTDVFDKIEHSPFLRGEGRWIGVTFDWVMKKANFQKILEGNYDG